MWNTIIVQPLTNLLVLITMLVDNFGIAIILFTIIIKLVTNPLTTAQLKSTKAMQDMQTDPRYKKLAEKYKDDKQMLAQEQMKLQKEMGVSPFGSCLPTLIQLPIIFGLYQAIMKAMASTPFELKALKDLLYPFINPANVLPINNRFLWMDLGQPERLNLFGIPIPVLAIVVVLTQYLLSKVMEAPSTGQDDQAAAMSKSMNMMMPLMMGYMAYQFSAGLALYFVITNVVTTIQYSIQGRTDWSKILPFIKPKHPSTPAVVDVKPTPITKKSDSSQYIDVPEDDDEEEHLAVTPAKVSKPSARSAQKKLRPKRKK
ncbi:MAG: YidC/Oxa1 family membrane protein insertase [Anaerolineaceae bacterium]